ncbi:L-lactate dehydrogenase [Sinanaerobacter sp. ZZT-01]|uniref:L-lactate dehydrogenase n=1 Tax=Sinanaerobacter sp. ZZT-01 TaxID=3111540 RepID=UPI002D767341|nr:L-lactate dehydrogenase [Sinanaerobacter sp. ZZT-01]WRR92436.1 L-lactate dehydrogenase [Sinanaerobacter sp. ZZT-01]
MSLRTRKVVIIGAGHVGSHAGYALAAQGLAEEIVYIDVDQKKAEAQALDIADSAVYLPHRVVVTAGTYEDASDADLLIVAAGPLPDMSKGQTRMDTLRQTVEVVKDIVENIKKSGFHGILVSISNPADVIAHYIQTKLEYPKEKVLSTSTVLDSARLRRAISQEIGVDPKSIYAYALGEHGESQMVAWSTVMIAGKPILELIKQKPEKYGNLNLQELAEKGRAAGWHILGGKGSTEFGIGTAAAEVTRAIFSDEKRILPVSVFLDGEYGQRGVYASVPAVVGNKGIEEIIELNMTEEEKQRFHLSCEIMRENYQLACNL